jgi:hypothetical protein
MAESNRNGTAYLMLRGGVAIVTGGILKSVVRVAVPRLVTLCQRRSWWRASTPAQILVGQLASVLDILYPPLTETNEPTTPCSTPTRNLLAIFPSIAKKLIFETCQRSI